MRIEQSFQVPYSYSLSFTRDLFAAGNTTLLDAAGTELPRLIFFVDAQLLSRSAGLEEKIRAWCITHRSSLREEPQLIVVPGGEALKNDFSIVHGLLEQLLASRLCRHSYAVIVGGGAVLDAVGFAAAIFHRGMRQIRVPTTLLAQADSGIGVKNAVNYLGVKNLVGCFSPPWAVINDISFISTLGPREIRAGVAEAIKVAIIKDAALFELIAAKVEAVQSRDLDVLADISQQSALLHMRHITTGGDPFECGSSRPLDFGHWSAHRLELLSTHALQHGEAVAIGICLDMLIAAELGFVEEALSLRVIGLFRRLGYQIWHEALERRQPDGQPAIIRGLLDFQEHLGGALTIPMPLAIGRMHDIHALDTAVVLKALCQLRDLARS